MFDTVKWAGAAWVLSAPGLALAANRVAMNSIVFVERTSAGPQGRNRTVLEQPDRIASGDKLVFMLNYRNRAAGPFVVTNPMPAAVVYQGSQDRGALVSIDGGRNWGALAQLRVTERDGSVRGARPEDVTHVRWTLDRAPAAGTIMFRGIVR